MREIDGLPRAITPDLKLVAFLTVAQVAAIFGQEGDKRWVYRNAGRHGFLYRATRRRPGTRPLFFDRAEIERIVAEFRAPE